MQHIDSLIGFDFVVGLVPHEEFDQLNVSMEACIVQRVESLLESRRCVDPLAHLFTHLEFYLVDCVDRELIGVTYTKAFTMTLL